MAGAARQGDVSFRAVLALAGQALALAAMLGVGIVLLEAPLAKVHCRKEAGNVGNGVKVAKSFVIHQVQIEDGPVLVLVVGDPDKLVAQRRRHDRHPNLEDLFESGQIIEGPGTIDGDAGFLAY